MALAQEEDTPRRLGHTKVTREEWLALAFEVLVLEGVEKVRVLTLGERLTVSRSSFYWYFKNRRELLDALLSIWERTNTAAIVQHAEIPSKTITEAICNLFHCFVNQSIFDYQLDFAIREWGRRSSPVRAVVDRSDGLRLAAIQAVYERHGFPRREAAMRARVLYYMQIGYYALELKETLGYRMELVPEYLEGFTGVAPLPEELEAFRTFAFAQEEEPAQARYLRFVKQAEKEGRS